MHVNASMSIRVHGQQSASEAMQLLQKPAEGEDTFSKPLKRSSCAYEDRCERFRVRERRFQQQYANLYFMRLSRMREMVKATALDKWGKSLGILITMRAFNIVGGWRQKPAINFFGQWYLTTFTCSSPPIAIMSYRTSLSHKNHTRATQQ